MTAPLSNQTLFLARAVASLVCVELVALGGGLTPGDFLFGRPRRIVSR